MTESERKEPNLPMLIVLASGQSEERKEALPDIRVSLELDRLANVRGQL
jgi:hypothetical protein